jgi:hypothetical protein
VVVCAWTCLSAFCTHPRVQGTLANTRLRVALKTLTEKQVKELSVERSPSRKKELATSGHEQAQKRAQQSTARSATLASVLWRLVHTRSADVPLFGVGGPASGGLRDVS